MNALKVITLVAVLSLAACAHKPPANKPPNSPSKAPLAYSAQDQQILWEEALSTFDGFVYTYQVVKTETQAQAQACIKKSWSCFEGRPSRAQKITQRRNEMPLALRDKITGLTVGELTEPLGQADGKAWFVIKLTNRRPAKFAQEVNPQAWLAQYASTSLPSAQALRTEPQLITRRQLNQVRNATDLKTLLTQQSITPAQLNAPLSNGLTPVIRAVFLDDMSSLTTLLDAGASADSCNLSTCALGTAVLLQKKEMVELLLKYKANPNAHGKSMPPLMWAASNADRPISQALLAAGANVLVQHTEYVEGMPFDRSVLFYAPSQQPEYVRWLQAQVDQSLAHSGQYDWSGWLVQGHKRQAIRDGATLKLERKPFKVVLHMSEKGSFRVLASADPTLLEKSRDIKLQRMYLHHIRIGATNADDKHLGLSSLETDPKDPELMANFSSNEWSYNADPELATGTQRIETPNGPEYIHTVDEFIMNKKSVPVAQYPGSEISLVMGKVPEIGAGADYFQPRRFRVRFSK